MKAAEEYLIRGRLHPSQNNNRKGSDKARKKNLYCSKGRDAVGWALEERAPTQVKLIERNRNFSRQNGGQKEE